MGLWTAVAAARVSLAAEAAALGECPPNVLIATPGRLMSHVKDSRISLSGLRFLVSNSGVAVPHTGCGRHIERSLLHTTPSPPDVLVATP